MATDLARAYRACARTTRRVARNFYFAFLSLPRAQRRAIYALYTFCHEADDCVDGAAASAAAETKHEQAALLQDRLPLLNDACADGAAANAAAEAKRNQAALRRDCSPSSDSGGSSIEEKRAGLADLRGRLAQAANGTPKAERDLALADAIARYGVREEDLRDVLLGVEMDLSLSRVETYDELRTYCYHVASAVGLATLPILTNGAPPTETMREAAIDLGLGMQYVNILRDVDEDLALGRIYLPSEELAAHGVDTAQLRARTMPSGLRALLATHAARARAQLSSGRRLLPQLPRRSRACPWLLSEIYGRILARIVEADYRVFEQRVSLPAIEKLWLLLSSTWRRV